jgi:hypothetical protein
MILITKASSFPNVHAAFKAIEQDNGGHLIGTVYPGTPIDLDTFGVPDAWGHLLEPAEAGLAGLRRSSEEDWETFVVGECSQQDAIRDMRGDLQEATTILNDYFNGWQDEDKPVPKGDTP